MVIQQKLTQSFVYSNLFTPFNSIFKSLGKPLHLTIRSWVIQCYQSLTDSIAHTKIVDRLH